MVWVGYRRPESEARKILEDEERLDELFESEEASADLDKGWHAIHWLLTSGETTEDESLSDAILGGEEIGEDLGYGVPRLLSPERVKAVAQSLGGIDAASLGARMDPQAMEAAEVYPSIWDEADVFDSYLAPLYESLREFYAAAADADEAVIQAIT